MKRHPESLTQQRFDVAVIGGGILGACVARDAALRGFSTALVEAGDFAASTSSNSLKVIHGGLRHFQHLDLAEVRASARERSTWLRIAPHLIEPLPVVMPLHGSSAERLAYAFVAMLNDLLTADRNRGLPAERSILDARMLTRRECLEYIPELESTGVRSALSFHDARMYSSERLVLTVVAGAVQAGAVAVNHAECVEPLIENGRREGIEVLDRRSGTRLPLRARVVINAAGPGAPALTRRLLGRADPHPQHLSLAWNLVLEGTGHEVAFALAGSAPTPTRSGGTRPRRLFFVPWRGRTLLGTGHARYHGDPSAFAGMHRDDPLLHAFAAEALRAWPGAPVSTERAVLVHAGLLPAEETAHDRVQLRRRHAITVEADGGVALITATTVKFTAARRVAEAAVDRACGILGHREARSTTSIRLLPGAPAQGVDELLRQAHQSHAERHAPAILEHLVRSHGTRYGEVLTILASLPESSEAAMAQAQMLFGMREEMACTVEDLLYRRTELGARAMITSEAQRQAEAIVQHGARELLR